MKRIHGAALNALVRKILAPDADYQTCLSAKDKENYRRRASEAAFQILLAEEVQKRSRSNDVH